MDKDDFEKAIKPVLGKQYAPALSRRLVHFQKRVGSGEHKSIASVEFTPVSGGLRMVFVTKPIVIKDSGGTNRAIGRFQVIIDTMKDDERRIDIRNLDNVIEGYQPKTVKNYPVTQIHHPHVHSNFSCFGPEMHSTIGGLVPAFELTMAADVITGFLGSYNTKDELCNELITIFPKASK